MRAFGNLDQFASDKQVAVIAVRLQTEIATEIARRLQRCLFPTGIWDGVRGIPQADRLRGEILRLCQEVLEMVEIGVVSACPRCVRGQGPGNSAGLRPW